MNQWKLEILRPKSVHRSWEGEGGNDTVALFTLNPPKLHPRSRLSTGGGGQDMGWNLHVRLPWLSAPAG